MSHSRRVSLRLGAAAAPLFLAAVLMWAAGGIPKGLLARRKVGRAFVYSPTVTRDELQGAVATELVQSLLRRDGSEPLPILSSLVDAVSERDRGLLDELERLVRAKRRTIDRGSAK